MKRVWLMEDCQKEEPWDESLFREYYDAYYKALVVFAEKYVDTQEIAEDIVQDVFFSTWEHRVDMSQSQSFRSYLFLSVRHHCLDHLRHENVEEAYARQLKQAAGKDEESLEDDWDETLFTEDIFMRLFEAVDRLSPRQQEILKLQMEGRRLTEIAEQLQVSYDTVKTQKRRALDYLRHTLKGQSRLLMVLFA